MCVSKQVLSWLLISHTVNARIVQLHVLVLSVIKGRIWANSTGGFKKKSLSSQSFDELPSCYSKVRSCSRLPFKMGKIIKMLVNRSQFSHSDVSDSLRLHELQHGRPPCPSPTPGVYSNSCPLSHWCYLTISSSVVPFPSHLQSFPASGSFQMSQFFASGGHKDWSFSFSISRSNEYSGLICFRMD